MPDDLNIAKWPRWALIIAAGIGMTMTGGIGTVIGVKIVDHEMRLAVIESTTFSDADGHAMIAELRNDFKNISTSLEDLKRDVAVLKSKATP
jgi:hypothetical protein